MRLVELRDGGGRGLKLRVALRENLRAILRAGIRALALSCGRVVRDEK